MRSVRKHEKYSEYSMQSIHN